MILVIDNYDSFTWNLVQLAGAIREDIRVIRNDELTVSQVEALQPEAIILSPGPGRPEEAGITMEVVQELGSRIPVLGVCLGHQAICAAFGGQVGHAGQLMHGKASLVRKEPDSWLLQDLPPEFPAARYHSLAAREDTLPPVLKVTARSADNEVMAVEHTQYPIYGVQFHPESILTPDGGAILRRFLEQAPSPTERNDEDDQGSH